VNIRNFANTWFEVRKEFYDEGKITKDYTNYGYRRILPPILPGEVRTVDLSRGITYKVKHEDLWGPSSINEVKKSEAEKVPRTVEAAVDAFTRKILPPLKISDDELDKNISIVWPARRSGVFGMVTVDISAYGRKYVEALSPSEWDELSQVLPVTSVSAYRPKNHGGVVLVAGDLVKRSKKEMDDEIRWLNEAAGYPVE
jgi:hypothetical protein